MRFRPRRFGLRSRITLAFALGSLLLSVTLSASTWAFTRQSQLNQREAAASRAQHSLERVVAFIVKPFSLDELRATLRPYLTS